MVVIIFTSNLSHFWLCIDDDVLLVNENQDSIEDDTISIEEINSKNYYR